MKLGQTLPRSPHAVHKWANEHRVQVWEMIEKLGKGEVSYREARKLLREEKKALRAVSKQVFRFKTNHAANLNIDHSASHFTRIPKPKRSAAKRKRAASHVSLIASSPGGD